MKKTDKFNFMDSPAANEISEEMAAVQTTAPARQEESEGGNSKDWWMLQTRIPTDLYNQFSVFCVLNRIRKGQAVAEALRDYLMKVNAEKRRG